ncbi:MULTISPECIES: hypothetical protein [Planktothricoides]|uniref:Uncharacterized protein n=2 Tax=Planktothricoides raciborskii TaxID=132608 RepID=A0AAU8JG29_9CYAN|nr:MULTISPECIES: hypothetical protein [Planktothricoides]MBD2544829.1 hypothetical protein [Planktothricoides raciborskii FACHB-1370]MBD2582764.1 hypothetical protein [Planktothricoides raciborskii FACHB-1261]
MTDFEGMICQGDPWRSLYRHCLGSLSYQRGEIEAVVYRGSCLSRQLFIEAVV